MEFKTTDKPLLVSKSYVLVVYGSIPHGKRKHQKTCIHLHNNDSLQFVIYEVKLMNIFKQPDHNIEHT